MDLNKVVLDLGHYLYRSGLELIRDAAEHAGHCCIALDDLLAGDSLNTAHTGGDGTFGDNGKHADLGGIVKMRAAAEFN